MNACEIGLYLFIYLFILKSATFLKEIQFTIFFPELGIYFVSSLNFLFVLKVFNIISSFLGFMRSCNFETPLLHKLGFRDDDKNSTIQQFF